MRLTGTDDTDIALDDYGQPIVASDGNCALVSGTECWVQDTYLEMLTEEGELLHEDEEGRWAYGFGFQTMLNGDIVQERVEIPARVREKLSKREYIDQDSIKTELTDIDRRGGRKLRVSFKGIDETAEINKDLRIDGVEVTIE